MVRLCSAFVVLFAAAAALAQTADSPQWRGPNRDGKSASTGLLKTWPKDGPKLLWTFRAAGRGFSSSAVVGGKVYTIGSSEDDCFVLCVNAANGKEIWRSNIDRAGKGADYLTRWGGGPRSTPTVADGKVYALSDLGTVACLSADKGEVAWKTNIVKEFGGRIPRWGYSESPLLDGDRVVVTPGGRNFLVALDKKSGKKIWGSKGINEAAHYVSAIKHTFGGTDIYITATNTGLLGIDAKTGEKLFSNARTGNRIAVVPTAIAVKDIVYHTSDYGSGCVAMRLKKSGGSVTAEQIYASKVMQNHHGGVVLVDDAIYGYSKSTGWVAHDFKTGDVLWTKRRARGRRGNSSGSVAFADGMLYFYTDSTGDVMLVTPSREAFKVAGQFKIPEQTKLARGAGKIWTQPVIAEGKLFLRDQDLIFAYDISGK